MTSQYEHLLKIKSNISLLQHFFPEHMLSEIIMLNPRLAMGKLNKMSDLIDTIQTMPKTYEQDGKGNEAIAYMHYRNEEIGIDWFITEKDMEEDQIQAFGAIIHDKQGSELSYINIEAIIQDENVTLNLDFTPMPIRQCLKYAADLNESSEQSPPNKTPSPN